MGTETVCEVCGRKQWPQALGAGLCSRAHHEAMGAVVIAGDCYRLGYAREKERAAAEAAARTETPLQSNPKEAAHGEVQEEAGRDRGGAVGPGRRRDAEERAVLP